MVQDQRKYSLDQVKKMLSHPFATNWGITEDQVATYWINNATDSLQKHVHYPSKSDLLNTVIPLLKNMMGGYANFLFISILEGGGWGANWLNHFSVSNNAPTTYSCTENDANYVLSCMNVTDKTIALSSPETNWNDAPEDNPGALKQFYRNSPAQSIARYYIVSTLAGNAWNWCYNWSMNSGINTWGDPYSGLIDIVKSFGKDPINGSFGTSLKGQGGQAKPVKNPDKKKEDKHYALKTITPGRIYLNGSNPVKLNDDLKFTRYKDFITINYEYDLDKAKEDPEEVGKQASNDMANQPKQPANPGAGGSNADRVKKLMARISTIWGRNYTYAMVRPNQDLVQGWRSDCSGFVSWCLEEIYPWCWNNGYSNTATLFSGLKSAGCQVFYTSGGISAMKSWSHNVVTGDVILMSSTSGMGAGGDSHVGIMGGNGAGAPFLNQHAQWGNSDICTQWDKSLTYHLDAYASVNEPFTYWAVMRIK